MSMSWYRSVVILIVIFVSLSGYTQPIGNPIALNSNTPTYAEAGIQSVSGDIPTVLAKSAAEEREPQVAILDNGSIVVFWVNRNGSHHISGMDSMGTLLAPVFETENDIDILLGVNTAKNTNWTLCKSNASNGNFFVAATFLADTLSGSDAVLADTIIDASGIQGDYNQGHGFFKIFNDRLESVTGPISISQFSAGHREWDGCWLSDGKFVISATCQDHPYTADPDYGTGGSSLVTLNLFNADGSRFANEFFVDDLTGEQRNVWLGALVNGFVCVYEDDDSRVGGEDLFRGIIFDNEGNKVKEFIVSDTENGIHPSWMAAGGGGSFVTVYEMNAPGNIGLPVDIVDMPVVLAQLWNDRGERVGPYILVSQHDDFRDVSRTRCAMARNGSFICSWIDSGADIIQFTDSVIARLFNADGTPSTDAFVAHSIPEFEDTYGGDPAESMPAINNQKAAVTWASRAVPKGQFRDIVLMAYNNPSTNVQAWELY